MGSQEATGHDEPPRREGRLRLSHGYELWYREVGSDEGRPPLLLLHGGPGAGSDYLETLEGLGSERRVVFYDQLGCGRSDHPGHSDWWTVEYFVAEMDEVRAALGLGRCHLLGQSWGGWLALDYLARGAEGIAGLVLASTSASIAEFRRETARLKAALPDGLGDTLERYEVTGEYDHPDYEHAVHAFYERHVCRLPEWPDCLMRTVRNLENTDVYAVMNGPNEFVVNGRLADWDRSEDLAHIAVPTLVTAGRYDELGPACAATLHRGIPGARLALFERSAHTAHLEEPALYLETVAAFLRTCDAVT